jgi:hypothetical protein
VSGAAVTWTFGDTPEKADERMAVHEGRFHTFPRQHRVRRRAIMSTLIWKLSPWDGEVHGFRGLDGDTAEALCEHTTPTTKLAQPGDQRRCMRCLLFHGDELADRIGDHHRYAP